MKKFFLFIVAILLLSSCACGECSTKYKVIHKTCDGNTLQEYYPNDVYMSGEYVKIIVKGKKKYLTGGIVIVEQL